MSQASDTPKFVQGYVDAALAFVAAAAAAGIHDAQELAPLVAFATAADERDDALNQYRKAEADHRRFSARHTPDDPGHDEHQRAIACAKTTLSACEAALATRRAEWRKARGL